VRCYSQGSRSRAVTPCGPVTGGRVPAVCDADADGDGAIAAAGGVTIAALVARRSPASAMSPPTTVGATMGGGISLRRCATVQGQALGAAAGGSSHAGTCGCAGAATRGASSSGSSGTRTGLRAAVLRPAIAAAGAGPRGTCGALWTAGVAQAVGVARSLQ